jgi:hypothetical protein
MQQFMRHGEQERLIRHRTNGMVEGARLMWQQCNIGTDKAALEAAYRTVCESLHTRFLDAGPATMPEESLNAFRAQWDELYNSAYSDAKTGRISNIPERLATLRFGAKYPLTF